MVSILCGLLEEKSPTSSYLSTVSFTPALSFPPEIVLHHITVKKLGLPK
jgi:hypothetical protein